MHIYIFVYDRALLAFWRTWRAYMARPELLTTEHDDQLAYLARQLVHAARRMEGR